MPPEPFRSPSRRRIAAVAVLVLATALSGCGRRGALEPPGTAEAPARTTLGSVPIGAPQPARPEPVRAPDRPFLLDWLL